MPGEGVSHSLLSHHHAFETVMNENGILLPTTGRMKDVLIEALITDVD